MEFRLLDSDSPVQLDQELAKSLLLLTLKTKLRSFLDKSLETLLRFNLPAIAGIAHVSLC